MTIMNDIRACLDNHLITMPSVPDVAFENVRFEPVNGQPFIRTSMAPTYRRPAVRGLNPQQEYRGIYGLLICTPEALGVGAGYDLADMLLSRFDATTDVVWANPYDALLAEDNSTISAENGDILLLGSPTIVSIAYAEVGVSYLDSPFYCTPINIGWYIYK